MRFGTLGPLLLWIAGTSISWIRASTGPSSDSPLHAKAAAGGIGFAIAKAIVAGAWFAPAPAAVLWGFTVELRLDV